MSLFLGFGLDHIVQLFRKGSVGIFFLPSLAVGCVLVNQWANADLSNQTLAYEYGRNVLDDLPNNAILITDGDDASYVIDYLNRIENVRNDVSVYNLSLIHI